MNTRNYEAVIFDMGGVLISGPGVHLYKMEMENGLEKGSLFKSIVELGDTGVWARWERGEFCYDEFKDKFEEEYFQLNGRRLKLKSTMMEWLPYTLEPEMIDKVRSLRSDGYKTALLTNNMFVTPGNSFLPIDRSIFDVIIESCKIGIRKPSAQIFEMCLNKLGVLAEKAVFLDDIGINLKGAMKLGIMTIQVTHTKDAILELDRVLSDKVPPGTIPISSAHQFNTDSLMSYLEREALISNVQGHGRSSMRKFSHGQSNPTYYLRVEDKEFVLRKKPPGKLLPSAHAIEREFSIMNSVGKYGVPVPRMIHLCEDSEIIGAPFYMMEYMNGSIHKDVSLPQVKVENKANIYSQVCDVLARIHQINTDDCGIGKKDGVIDTRREYLRRNIKTWWKQYELSETSRNTSMEILHEWLLTNLPNDSAIDLPCTLCHGDFRLDNMIFSKDEDSAKLLAVIDWELSSFGDPVTDLATVCFPYYSPRSMSQLGVSDMIDFKSNLPEGVPTMENFINDYCKKMGIKNIINIKFYQIFVLFRFAAILTGVAKRAQAGQNPASNAESFRKFAFILAQHGVELSNEKEVNNSSTECKGMPLGVDGLRKEVRVMYARVKEMVNEDIIPAERELTQFYQNQDNAHVVHPLMEKWKENAKKQKLWNFFLPIESDVTGKYGQGLTNLEYGFLCEEMGRSLFAPEVFNCSAPDTGNMEILAKYGTEKQKQDWLQPMLDGKIRSCFAMTEPGVASSDARNIMAEIKDGGNEEYVINGHKWWTSGALHPNCDLCILMGKTDPTASEYMQQSMVLVPMKSPGVKIIRPLNVFGFWDLPGGHAEITFTNVRVPKANILLGEGKGFQIAQGRLGPGRVHHCMRMIGYAERSLELVMDRIDTRETFGKKLSDHGTIQLSIAKSKIEIEQARLLVMKTAHMMDLHGNKKSKLEIAMIKVVVPNMAVRVIDRAIQCFGGAGFCNDYPLAMMYAMARVLRVADGPDEVHIQSIARQMIKDHNTGQSRKAQL